MHKILFQILACSKYLNFTISGVDCTLYKVPVFVAEIAPKELRGTLTTLNQVNLETSDICVCAFARVCFSARMSLCTRVSSE